MNKTTLNSQKEKHSMLSLRRATFRRQRARRGPQHFYPRSPCGERPLSLLRSVMFMALFLSTLSLRRATWHLCFCIPCQCNFYPRSPCGERHQATCTQAHYIRYFYPRSPCGERRQQATICIDTAGISIHALLAESDGCRPGRPKRPADFYPRSPCGERLPRLPMAAQPQNISIHALLAESDPAGKVRPWASHISIHALLAESDVRRATGTAGSLAISIHALLAESDPPRHWHGGVTGHFYPRSPCGERRMILTQRFCASTFLSTLSLRRATCYSFRHSASCWHFYPRSPCGERPVLVWCSCGGAFDFYPRSPCGERPPLPLQVPYQDGISIHALLAESDRWCSR